MVGSGTGLKSATLVLGVHGVLAEEQKRAQPFSIDIVAWTDMSDAQQSDNLGDTVDYGALAQLAADVVSRHSYQLLEALAGRLADALFGLGPSPVGRGRHGAQASSPTGLGRGVDRSTGLPVPLVGVSPDRQRAFLGLGANLGERRGGVASGHRDAACQRRERGHLAAVRNRTGWRSRGSAVVCSTWWSEIGHHRYASAIAERCQALEEAAHRVRTVRFGPRTLDADVLLVGDLVVDEPDLSVPHPGCGSAVSWSNLWPISLPT